ncbi:MAG: recombinase family protein [Microbacteriaceae bacterium]
MQRRAIAYVRRSHDDNGGNVSRETQEDAVRSLAAQHGQSLGDRYMDGRDAFGAVDVYVDWGRSGGDAPEDALRYRPAFRALLREVEAGHVSHVFALKLDRLGRGQTALSRLWAAAEATGTLIVTREEGRLDADNPAAWLLRHTLSGFAEFYLREQKRKSARTLAYQRKRGDAIGLPTLGTVMRREDPTDPRSRIVRVVTDPGAVQRVIDAYTESGSYLGAASLLNAAREPVPLARQTRRDGQPYGNGRYAEAKWHPGTVRGIVTREAPALASPPHQSLKGAGSPRLLRGLLRCSCGTVLTPGGSLRNRSLSYFCNRGHRDPIHPKPYTISEKRLMVWVREEAARYRPPLAGQTVALDSGETERDLPAERERIVRTFTRGLISEEQMDAMLVEVDALLAERELVAFMVPFCIDWTADVATINDVLRSIWHRVELGPDLHPIRADWKVPAWRAEDAAAVA